MCKAGQDVDSIECSQLTKAVLKNLQQLLTLIFKKHYQIEIITIILILQVKRPWGKAMNKAPTQI